MTSVSWEDDGQQEVTASSSTVRWKGRTLVNFAVGRSRVRALPVVIHFLPEDIGWFSSDSSLFDELKLLLRERVIAATGNGDKDAEAPKSRKRARKEEVCVQGERLQFTFRYRKTLPRYTVLSYAGDDNNAEGPTHSSGSGSRGRGSAGSGGKSNKLPGSTDDNGPGFRHLPLSESTLLVWVYRFDKDDPYRPVPNQAALQFAPTAAKAPSSSAVAGEALDVEAIGRRSGAAEGATVGMQGGPRDTGLLAWLWGGGGDGGLGGGGGGGGSGGGGQGRGGVRQHFIGSASWQGRPAAERAAVGRGEEEDDIQRAIQLSLAMASGEAGGVEESKG